MEEWKIVARKNDIISAQNNPIIKAQRNGNSRSNNKAFAGISRTDSFYSAARSVSDARPPAAQNGTQIYFVSAAAKA